MSRRPVAPPPKQRSGTGRTIILVAVASIVAGLIIGRGLSNDSASGTGSGPTATDSSGNTTATTKKPKAGQTTTTAAPVITTTTQPAVVLNNFTAIVLNGNGIGGTAASRTTELAALGVKTVKAADATTKNYETSAIYALNAEAVPAAKLVAAKSGIVYGDIYPTATPPAPVEKLGNATIILLLGKDIASKPITDITAGGAAAPAATPAATPTTVKA